MESLSKSVCEVIRILTNIFRAVKEVYTKTEQIVNAIWKKP